MKAINVYVVFQADGIDHEITDLQIMDDPGALGRFSQALEAGTTMFKLWAEGHGGRAVAVMQGGGVLEVSADIITDLPELQGQYEGRVDCSVSIGVGVKLNEAQRALMAAQKNGRGKLRLYDSEVETELAEELSKADQSAPPLAQANIVRDNKTTLNSPAAGGGMKGAQEPTRATPQAPMTEASEHSENEALQNQMAAAPDPLSQFSSLAEQSEGEQSEKEASDDEAQEDGDVKKQLVEILQAFREQAPVFEQLKESSPELYKTLVGMIQAMVKMGQQLYGQPEGGDPQGGQPEEVAKAELEKALPHGAKLTTNPREIGGGKENRANRKAFPGSAQHKVMEDALGGPEQVPVQPLGNGLTGKPIDTSKVNYVMDPSKKPEYAHRVPGFTTPYIPPEDPLHGTVRAEPWGDLQWEKDVRYPDEEIGQPVNRGIPAPDRDAWARSPLMNKKNMAKAALEAGKTGRHNVVLPVGSQKDASAEGTREAGKLKVATADGKTKWRSVRAGLVMAPDGSPVSSRNPGGGE